MNEERQDMIDRYIRGEMNDREKAAFETQLAADAELKDQFDFTVTTVAALRSRREKLKRIEEWRGQLDFERSGVRADLEACMASDEVERKVKPAARRPLYKKVAAILSVAAIIVIAFLIFIPPFQNSRLAPPADPLGGHEPFVIDHTMMEEYYGADQDSTALPADSIPDPTE